MRFVAYLAHSAFGRPTSIKLTPLDSVIKSRLSLVGILGKEFAGTKASIIVTGERTGRNFTLP